MSDLQILLNTQFDLRFGDRTYSVKKASLEQVALYFKRIDELKKNNEPDIKSVGYALFLILSKADPSITEEFVMENTAGDLDAMDTLLELGFINPKRVGEAKRVQESLISRFTGKTSSPSSQSGQDGVQNK
jgi:hypothetical protein